MQPFVEFCPSIPSLYNISNQSVTYRYKIDECLDSIRDEAGSLLGSAIPLKMHGHKKFLTDQLLSEKRPVTYRILSRALDVHVSTAKCMLYEFYQDQNALNANCVYATFAIYGRKSTKNNRQNGDDVDLNSSIPESESRAEVIPGQILTLVGEENLEAILLEYEEVSSAHVYCLTFRQNKAVARLADVVASILGANEEPLSGATKYGTISNTVASRRDPSNRLKPPVANSSNHSVKLPGKSPVQLPDKGKEAPKAKKAAETPAQATLKRSSEREPASASRKRGFPPVNTLPFKKSASGSSMKPSRAIQEGEDDTPALSDDGEADNSDVLPSKPTPSTLHKNTARDNKNEREKKLKHLMDSDDEELDMEKDEASQPEPLPEPLTESEPEPKTETVTKPPTCAEVADVAPSSANGRRRGKRRVMKKKRILDDQGYMVTIQTPEWESFSEDDTPQASVDKATSTSNPTSSEMAARKTSGKTSQGKIRSFFKKG